MLLTLASKSFIVIIGQPKVERREMKDNVKMGRPLTSEEPRTIRLSLRLDKKEHEELKEKAKKKNMTISEYLRYLFKNDK